MSMVSWIVDRMHIGTTPKEIVREFHGRFKKYARKNKVAFPPRAQRRVIYREALDHMKDTHELLRSVNLK